MSDLLKKQYWLNHGYSKRNAEQKAMQENYIEAHRHTVSDKESLAELKSEAKRKFPLYSEDFKKSEDDMYKYSDDEDKDKDFFKKRKPNVKVAGNERRKARAEKYAFISGNPYVINIMS